MRPRTRSIKLEILKYCLEKKRLKTHIISHVGITCEVFDEYMPELIQNNLVEIITDINHSGGSRAIHEYYRTTEIGFEYLKQRGGIGDFPILAS
jgi:predicted transcriptional regulator